jgi:hypothetical protein
MRSRPAASPVVRAVALALLLLGAALMVGAVFADQLDLSGIGGESGEGFGWSQLVAAIVGLILLLVGVSWLWQAPAGRDADESIE